MHRMHVNRSAHSCWKALPASAPRRHGCATRSLAGSIRDPWRQKANRTEISSAEQCTLPFQTDNTRPTNEMQRVNISAEVSTDRALQTFHSYSHNVLVEPNNEFSVGFPSRVQHSSLVRPVTDSSEFLFVCTNSEYKIQLYTQLIIALTRKRTGQMLI